MREENGNSTRNARIKIDYSKNKPKVTFSYPSKNGVQGSMLWIIFVVYFLITTPLYFYISYQEGEIIKNKEESQIQNSYNLSNYSEYIKFHNENNILNKTFENINLPEKKALEFVEEKLKSPLIIIMLSWFIVPLTVYFLFRKRWRKLYPKFQGIIASKKITKFKEKDIKFDEKENKYYCELISFNNIILDYKAIGDFSKYLNLFEIKEHNFKSYFKKRKLNKKMKERRKGREINEFIWYARFYFNQKPKRGYIEVIYK
jgi:hypothetical protein